jgi:hypothetical protein
MRLLYIALTLFLFAAASTSALSQRNCGTMEYLQQEIEMSPERLQQLEAIEKHTREFLNNPDRNTSDVIVIPVVVHVVYNTTAQNISDAQVLSQITVLNEDFRLLNANADNTWPQAADSEIEFCMATIDPNGNPTNGITRTFTTTTAFTTNNNVKFTASGGQDAWPAGQYLNIWVCNLAGGLLGYAQFPGGNPATDGIVCDFAYFGTIGTATPPFHLGRTATHEVGHWLNLRHIWGDGPCGVDDFVADTPESDAPNYGCPIGHVSCGTVDMVQNYMDYTDDACMNLFTQGQKSRMRALFNPGGARFSILSSPACGSSEPTCDDGIQNGQETGIDCGGPDCPPCPTCFDGIQNGQETGIDCGGPDCPPCPTCDDGIQNGQETGIDCGGPDCPPCPCEGTWATLTLNFDLAPGQTSWALISSSGATIAAGGPYTSQAANSSLTEEICIPDGCHTFIIYDSGNNGMCCRLGNGSYQLTDENGNTLASGAQFGASESTDFCLGDTGTPPTCDDGIQNGQETGIDCGGPDCPPCPVEPTCDDGIQNGQETGIDCGGPDCPPCPVEPTCDDGIQNGQETGVDCGGPDCPPCPTCFDGIQNGQETGVDCGGPDCPPCEDLCPFAVRLQINFDFAPQETSWNITDSNGDIVEAGGPYTNQAPNSTLIQDICLDEGCYTFTIFDSGNNGLCCQAGRGSYLLTRQPSGSLIAAGGAFGASQATPFCSGGSRQRGDFAAEEDRALQIFPNPANQLLHATFKSRQATTAELRVLNVTGGALQQLRVKTDVGVQNIELDVSQLVSGIYFLEVRLGEDRFIKKFVVAR